MPQKTTPLPVLGAAGFVLYLVPPSTSLASPTRGSPLVVEVLEHEAPYAIERVRGAVRLRGDLRMADASSIWSDLCLQTSGAEPPRLDFDLSGVDFIDGGIMSLVVQLRADLAVRGVQSEVTGASPRVAELVELYGGVAAPARDQRRKPEGLVAQVGRNTIAITAELRLVVTFFGSMIAAAIEVARRPRTGNWRDVLPLVERSGADAVPIVLLLNFLVGSVMGFQSAKQLQNYGASIFVADLVGLSVTRELAPLMTAIIVAGRSGAAFAAELGSMKVSEEIDALRAMGFGPMRYLVMPRTIALILVVPVLTLLADIVGILGGLVVATTTMGVSASAYFHQTQSAVFLWDVQSGLIKSVAYAIAIALIACQQGFATTGGAEGVGRRTTSTVVTCLFAIVLIDTFLTVVFSSLGR
jgi:phospholipid/cholesterol/gamma-HCH transport system permease protein